MSTSIHGHEVMQMMLTHGGSFTRDSLRQAIHDTFGVEARFHTCSTEGMDADQLIAFLERKGKFVDESDGFQTRADRICNHG